MRAQGPWGQVAGVRGDEGPGWCSQGARGTGGNSPGVVGLGMRS